MKQIFYTLLYFVVLLKKWALTLRGRLGNSYNLQSPEKDFVTYFVKLIINIGPNQSGILAKYHHIDFKSHRQNNIADILYT